MLYVVFIFAVVVTILYFTEPEFTLRQKYRGQDLYEILSDEEHKHRLKLLGRGLYAILYSLVYCLISLIAVPLIILWAISNEIGSQVASFIAIAAVLALLFQFGQWLWQMITGNKGKADILTDDGKRYRGELISEDKIVKVDATIKDAGEDIHLTGILLGEDDDKVTMLTSEGIKIAHKHPYDLIHMDKKTIINAEIELKDGSRKTGRKIYILGDKPAKDFLRNLPDLLLVLYLWYLVVVQFIN